MDELRCTEDIDPPTPPRCTGCPPNARERTLNWCITHLCPSLSTQHESTYFHTIHLFDRYCAKVPLCHLQYSRVLAACCMVATKLLDDLHYTDLTRAAWRGIGIEGTIHEIAALELHVCKVLDWDFPMFHPIDTANTSSAYSPAYTGGLFMLRVLSYHSRYARWGNHALSQVRDLGMRWHQAGGCSGMAINFTPDTVEALSGFLKLYDWMQATNHVVWRLAHRKTHTGDRVIAPYALLVQQALARHEEEEANKENTPPNGEAIAKRRCSEGHPDEVSPKRSRSARPRWCLPSGEILASPSCLLVR